MSASTGDSRDVRRVPLVSVVAKDTVQRAAEVMRNEHVGFLVVLDDAGHLAGVLTDRDVTRRVLAKGADPAELQVGDVMSRDVERLASGRDEAEAAERMRRRGVRRLPVVDVAGRPIAVSSADDLLCVLAERLGRLARGARVASHDRRTTPTQGEPHLGKE